MHVRIAVGVVLGTVYVVALAICIRVVFLTSYEEFLNGLRIVSDFLLEGGTFALIVHLIRRRIPDRAVDGLSRRFFSPGASRRPSSSRGSTHHASRNR